MKTGGVANTENEENCVPPVAAVRCVIMEKRGHSVLLVEAVRCVNMGDRDTYVKNAEGFYV